MIGILKYMNSQHIDNDTVENNLFMLYKTDMYRKEQLLDSIPALVEYFNN